MRTLLACLIFIFSVAMGIWFALGYPVYGIENAIGVVFAGLMLAWIAGQRRKVRSRRAGRR